MNLDSVQCLLWLPAGAVDSGTALSENVNSMLMISVFPSLVGLRPEQNKHNRYSAILILHAKGQSLARERKKKFDTASNRTTHELFLVTAVHT